MQKLKLISFIILLVFGADAQNLDPAIFHSHRQSLNHSFLKFEKDKQGRVAFLGGSITHNPGWRDSVVSYLTFRFPETKFDFINAGIPSMGSTPGAFRFRRDVLKNGQVDLLFVEAAVNDATNQRKPDEILRGMEGIVRHTLRENSLTDIVIMHFADPEKMKSYRSDSIPEVIRLHEKVAKYYHIPTINLAKEVTKRINVGEFSWEDDFRDLHPSPFGQQIYTRSIIKFLEDERANVPGNTENEMADIPKPLDPKCYDNGVLIEPNPPKPISGWKLIGNWQPQDNALIRTNYTKVPNLEGTYPGEIIKFPFKGNAVGIAVAAGPDAGIIEYSIDGGQWQKLDLFTPWSINLHLPWYYTFGSGLKNRKHMLQIRMTNDKNPESIGSVCRIRYFYFNAVE